MNRHCLFSALALGALALGGCGRPSPQPPAAARPANGFPGMEADLKRTLSEQADFYVFRTPADFARDTRGLSWEDGSDLPEFADLSAKKGGTLTEWLPDYPATLRTIGPDANGFFRPFLLDYVALNYVRPHPNLPGKYFPELASAWAVDRTNKTVYFKLDPRARWSDGVPMTTDDVVFSFYFNRSKYLNEPWYNDFYTKYYRRLTVYDAHTFAVTLKELIPDIVDKAGYNAPFPKHFFTDFGPGWNERYNWRICPTTGAYTVRPEDIRRQVSITLSHVPNWWAADRRFMRGRFNPDRVRFVVIRDPDKAFEAFVRGDIDILPVNSPQLWYDRLPDTHPSVASGFTVKAVFYNQIPVPDIGLWINEAKPLLDNRDVRIGIAYASDFDLVCRQYFRGDAVRQKTRSDGYGWDVNPAVRPRPFDPVKARESFARAGFTRQGPDGILVNGQGQRLAFTITTPYRRFADVLAILKQEALKAGLDFNIEVLDTTTAFEKVDQKQHDIALIAMSRAVEMYPRYWEFYAGVNAYDVPYLPDGSPNPARKLRPDTNNMTSTAIPELDRLIGLYDKAESMEQVKALAARIEAIIAADGSWVPGWKQPFLRLAYRPWVKWPADFAPMQSLDSEEFWTFWIDQDLEREALEAKAAGRSLPPQILTYDRYKEP